jgi:spore germination protein KA
MSNKAYQTVEYLKSSNEDISVKQIPYFGGCIWMLYIRQIIDKTALTEYIIKPIMQCVSSGKKTLKAQQVMDNVIFTDDMKLESDLSKVEQLILEGNCILLFSSDKYYISANIRKVAQRNVTEPEMRYSYRGPRDAFVEEIDVNLSLIRKRLKDRQLKIDKTEVGKRSKTKVAVLYMGDITSPEAVREIKKRIDGIDTDLIIETGELQTFLLNNQHSLFPIMGVLEKPDQAIEKLLEGKVVVMVDGACTVLCAPKTFAEFFYSEDDHYEDQFFGLFMRIIRYIGIFVSSSVTSIYIAVGTYNPSVLPANYIVTFAQMRSRAPFPTFVAVLLMEFAVELIREALLRVPKKMGTAVAIVGAIIIGQAAISSGAFSPLLLIILSIGFLATFALPDYTIAHAFRILKFLLILLTTFYGFYGLSLGVLLVLTNLVSINSFGIPYMAPISPFNRYDFARFFMFRRKTSPLRQQYMRNIDNTRASSAHNPKNKKKGKFS